MKRRLLAKTVFTLAGLSLFGLVIASCGGGGGGGGSSDDTPPTILATSPADDATGVDPGAVITITFSEPMDTASVEDAFLIVPPPVALPLPPGTFSWNAAKDTVTFTPGADLAESTDYTVTVSTYAEDAAGNNLEAAYTFTWRTALSYQAIALTSDFLVDTSNGGVIPSLNGQYLFWWDGTINDNPSCNYHLYRVKIADRTSQTVWTNRSVWGSIYDDGTNTWVGNYYPYEAAKILNANPGLATTIYRDLDLDHTLGLNGNRLIFPYVYFGTSSGMGIGYWNRSTDTVGRIAASNGAYVYQSAVIGKWIYFPKGNTTATASSPGIMVVDGTTAPPALPELATTLLDGDSRIADASEVIADDTHLYVRNGLNRIVKIDPTVPGSVVATFPPPTGVTLTNPVIVGDDIYAGATGDKRVYIMDKTTGSILTRDCSAKLPTAVGSPRWDFYNEGIWYGPQSATLTSVRWTYFIPKSMIDSECTVVPTP